jgi:ribosomal protein S18 acetylase RimI-like enzyme
MVIKPRIHHLSKHNADMVLTSDVFDYPVLPEQLDRFLADKGHAMVFATVEGAVVGFASGTVLLHPDKEPAFFVNEIGVNEGFLHKGIATALCQALITLARDQGCKGIWLATEADNAPARALYRKLQARETEGVVVYDWDGALDV